MAMVLKVSIATMELKEAGVGISHDSQAIPTTSILDPILVINTVITQSITTLNQYRQGSLRLVVIPVVAAAIHTVVHSF
jgi:hypothetical protein